MNWHRLFGLVLMDYFSDSPFDVELEKDLSIKQQFLDVVIIRKRAGAVPFRLPDGFEGLTEHNLVSFKSHQDVFDAWTMKELLGHYVNYRKQVAPSLAEDQFQLYGVCARYPQQLAAQIELQEVRAGVLTCRWGTDVVRLIVLRDLPREEHNAPLQLFSAMREQVEYAQKHYKQRSPTTSSLVERLLGRYQEEGVMPYTMEDFRREAREEILREATVEERLQGLGVEELLRGLDVEKLLRGLDVEERLRGLSAAEIEAYLKKLKDRTAETERSENKEG